MPSVSLQYNPWIFTPRLPELPLQLVDALAETAAVYATSWKNGAFHNKDSFNWIPTDSIKDWNGIVPTHGNFAGPGYGGGDRTPKTKQQLEDAPVSRVDDPATGVERDDEIDLIAKPHDIAYIDAEAFKESNFSEYLKQIIAADQALIDGTRVGNNHRVRSQLLTY